MVKLCKSCSLEKDETEFDAPRRVCRECRGRIRRAQYSVNKAEILKSNLQWKHENKVKMTETARNSRYLYRYGITTEEYDQMLQSQGSKCKICGGTDTGRKTSRFFSIDHCHVTNNVRGLLCHPCNVGIGKFNDDPVLIRRAIQYLKGEL
jgi:hypothetical protein